MKVVVFENVEIVMKFMFYKKAAKNDKISVAFLGNRPCISQCSNQKLGTILISGLKKEQKLIGNTETFLTPWSTLTSFYM